MSSRRHQRLLLLLALVVGLVALSLVLTGLGTGLLYLAPALMLLAPLALERYVGEETIHRLKRAVATRRRRRPARSVAAPLPIAPRTLMVRGGALLAASLAVRPPPAAALR
jgi:hypothetical protein